MTSFITIAEMPEFMRRAAKLLSVEERMALLVYLAANPRAGDLVPGTVFGKNERADLTAGERNELAGLARTLKATMRSPS